MLYSLLGRTVWFGLKLFMRRKYGSASVPKPLVAGAVVLVAAGTVAAVVRGRSDES